jgi:hypothetical protein
VLLSARRKISPGYFQSLGTDSCELIVIGRAGGHISLSTSSFVSITCPLIFFVAAFVSLSTLDALQGEKRKSLFMANYGMRVAMNIGVIQDDVMSFYLISPSRRLRSFGCKFSCKGMGHPGFSVAKACKERWMNLSVNLALGGGNRVIRAQRIG